MLHAHFVQNKNIPATTEILESRCFVRFFLIRYCRTSESKFAIFFLFCWKIKFFSSNIHLIRIQYAFRRFLRIANVSVIMFSCCWLSINEPLNLMYKNKSLQSKSRVNMLFFCLFRFVRTNIYCVVALANEK